MKRTATTAAWFNIQAGPFHWHRTTAEERKDWLRIRDPIPEDAPKMPWSWWNRKPGNSGKRYATRQDERDYDKAFKEWYQREVVEGGRKMYTLDNKLIEPLPYHTDEAHAVFLKEFAEMSNEDKLRLGHTIDEERSQSFAEVFGPGHYQMQIPNARLYKNDKNMDGCTLSDTLAVGLCTSTDTTNLDPTRIEKEGTTFNTPVPDFAAQARQMAEEYEAKKASAAEAQA